MTENRPGAGGNIGTEAVVNAAPDGYTLLLATVPNAVNASLYDKLNFDFVRGIAPVAGIIRVPMVILLHPSVPARTVPELIGYAKANPGKINMASAGNGSAPHMAGELFKMMAGVNMVHVPYRGQGPALSDLLGGQVQVLFATAPGTSDYISTGKLRALAVTSSTRLPTVPELPPFGEAVGVPDFETVSWHVLLAPAGTPPEVVAKLHAEMKRIMQAPDMRKKVADVGLIPQDIAPLQSQIAYIKAEGEKWGTPVRQLGLEGSQ